MIIFIIQITATMYILTFSAVTTQKYISSQPDEFHNLCPGEEVNIICEIRGSPILAWSSNEYIGGGGIRFEFLIIDSVGATITSHVNPNTVTVATLINRTIENGVVILVSQLHIIALSGVLTSSVTCINPSNGTMDTIMIHVLGMFHLLICMAESQLVAFMAIALLRHACITHQLATTNMLLLNLVAQLTYNV